MAVKTAISVASYWAQTRNKTVFKSKDVSIYRIFLDEMVMGTKLAYFGGYVLPLEQTYYISAGVFAQISLYWETRQMHSKRS